MMPKRKSEKTKKTRKIQDQTIDSLYIPKSTIESMNELNHKTAKDGREHGMALCLNPQKRVVPGRQSTGDFVSIDVPETCRNKEDMYIGTIHTHPAPSETRFSAMDLFSSCDKKSKIDCVGMNKEGEIQCFVKKDFHHSCQEESKPFVDIEDTYVYLDRDDKEIVQEALLKAVDNFTDEKFKNKKIL